MVVLESFAISWLVDVEENVTIVDKAMEWLSQFEAEVPLRARRSSVQLQRRASFAGPHGGGFLGRVRNLFESIKQVVLSIVRDSDEVDETNLPVVRQRGPMPPPSIHVYACCVRSPCRSAFRPLSALSSMRTGHPPHPRRGCALQPRRAAGPQVEQDLGRLRGQAAQE